MEPLKLDWKSSDFLNAEDLNRMEEWSYYLSDLLAQYGYTASVSKREKREKDVNTLLLLHGENIEDSSLYKMPLSNVGVTVSTAQSKFGGKSLYFGGENQRIEFPQKSIIYGVGDFTFDWWEYTLRKGCRFNSSVFGAGTSNSDRGLQVGNGGVNFIISATGVTDEVTIQDAIRNVLNQWVHQAVVRKNGVLTTYLNGKKVTTAPAQAAVYQKGNRPQGIGVQRTDMANMSFMGYMDEFRISDVARWTTDFTPPDKPYEVEEKPYWNKEDIPPCSDVDRIRTNITALRNGFFSIPEWRELVFGNYHDFNQQNAMEWDLQTCYNWLKRMIQIFVPCGVYNCGGALYLIDKRPELKPSDPHTLLLIHGDKIEDSSQYKVPLTNQGVTVSTVQRKFGGKSLCFNRSCISANILPINGDFTIDFWVYIDKNTPNWYECSVSITADGDPSTSVSHRPITSQNKDYWDVRVDGLITNLYATKLFPIKEWHHIALVKEKSNYSYYIDGTRATIAENVKTQLKSLNSVYIGRIEWNDKNAWLFGYIDEFRISNVARWTSDFTPPDKPYES